MNLLTYHNVSLIFNPLLFYQEQSRLLEIDQKHQRAPNILSMIKSSPEMAGSIFVQDLFIPSLSNIINELQNQALNLQKEMEQSHPILQTVFPVSEQNSQLHSKSADFTMKKSREVWHHQDCNAQCIIGI